MKRTLLTLCLAWSTLAQAQFFGDSNWQEGPVPTPPDFNVERLLRFEVNASSPLIYAIDPQTLSISPTDRVVRYVVVATSPSGVRNVFYEGIRCPSGQVKAYARHSDGRWQISSDPQWQDMSRRPSLHAWQLARQGACDSGGTPLNAQDILRALGQSAVQMVR
jgi:hypothetical protein